MTHLETPAKITYWHLCKTANSMYWKAAWWSRVCGGGLEERRECVKTISPNSFLQTAAEYEAWVWKDSRNNNQTLMLPVGGEHYFMLGETANEDHAEMMWSWYTLIIPSASFLVSGECTAKLVWLLILHMLSNKTESK